MKLNDILKENREYMDIYDDLMNDLSVQQLVGVIERYRQKGVEWQVIYDQIEDLEDEAQTELSDEERIALLSVLRYKEGKG